MKVYIVVGENRNVNNISARAAYSTQPLAEAHLADPQRMYFDDRAVIVPLEIDVEVK
jgi:hypothetical protein